MEDYQQQFTVFEYQFDSGEEHDTELIKSFENFFVKNNLLPIFTDEHLAPPIKVSWTSAKSVVNETGFGKKLKDFSDVLNIAEDNQKYNMAIFKMIFVPTTFENYMRKVEKVNEYFIKVSKDNKEYNFWNTVWYAEILD